MPLKSFEPRKAFGECFSVKHEDELADPSSRGTQPQRRGTCGNLQDFCGRGDTLSPGRREVRVLGGCDSIFEEAVLIVYTKEVLLKT